MPDSIRERLLQTILAALSAPGGPAGVTWHRSRTRPLAADDLPAGVLYVVEETTGIAGASDSLLARHLLTVRIESRAAGDPPDAALDAQLQWVVAQMCADRRWGGLAANTIESKTTWTAEGIDEVYGAAAQEFLIDYLTLAADATSQG